MARPQVLLCSAKGIIMSPLHINGFLSSEISSWITEYRKTYSDLFDFAEELNRQAHEVLFNIDAHNQDIEEVLIASLFLRTIHTYQGVILLVERGMIAQARMLARCMFDSLFPLCAIVRDENREVYREFVLVDHITRRKFVRKYRKLATAEEKNLKILEDLETELESEIKDGDIKEIRTVDWAEKAGLLDWYNSIYSTLSNTVHSNVRDLEHYYVRNHENQIKEFKWWPDDTGIEDIFITVFQIIITCMLAVAEFFNQRQIDKIKGFQQRLDDITRRCLKSDGEHSASTDSGEAPRPQS